MLMTNDTIRLFPHDRVFAKVFIPLIPSSVRPNHFTVLRFVLIPLVLFSIWLESWPASLTLFLLASFTDALDGSLARLRKQITMWGTVADPIADKLLIGSVVVLFVAREIHPGFAALIVLLEILIVIGALLRRRRGSYVAANEYGKLKMFFQVVGVTFLLLAKLIGITFAIPFAIGTFSLALIFAMVSLVTYGF